MANSKKLVEYVGEELAKISVPTSVNSALVREIDDGVFSGAESVLIDTFANDILHYSSWGAQNVVWLKEPKCTISFDANNGSGTMENLPANIGIVFIIPTCKFWKFGGYFEKWGVGSVEGPYVLPGDNYAFGENTTLYAIWTINWEEPVLEQTKLTATQFLTITEGSNKITVE